MHELTGVGRRYFYESLQREESRWSSFEDSEFSGPSFRHRRRQLKRKPGGRHESGPVSVLRVEGLRVGRQNLLCGLE